MKKTLFVITAVLVMCCGFWANAQATEFSVAINSPVAVSDGNVVKINAPLLVFGTTYVDLYETAAFLHLPLEWVDAETDYVKAGYEGGTTDFSIVATYDELSLPNKCFVKDGRIFAKARDVAVAAGVELNFDNWVISFGKTDNSVDKTVFEGLNPLINAESYIYDTYCYQPQHCVYPYQKYSYEFMVNDSQRLAKLYPEIIKTGSIGKSVEGRDLVLIEFGKGAKKIFVCGAHHAREYITTTYLMYAIDRFSYIYRTGGSFNGYNVKEILDNVTFCIVPMVNPDGINLLQNGIDAVVNKQFVESIEITEGKKNGILAWKANINGVDLNWNYDKDWSKEKEKTPYPASAGYNGEMPNTEPETRAVSAYVDSYPFKAFLSFHTQGNILYWAEDAENPTNLGEMVSKDTGFKLFREDEPKKLEGVGGSFFDYVYRKYKKATMTVELCDYIGPKPYPDEKFGSVWKSAENVLLIFGSTIMNRE